MGHVQISAKRVTGRKRVDPPTRFSRFIVYASFTSGQLHNVWLVNSSPNPQMVHKIKDDQELFVF